MAKELSATEFLDYANKVYNQVIIEFQKLHRDILMMPVTPDKSCYESCTFPVIKNAFGTKQTIGILFIYDTKRVFVSCYVIDKILIGFNLNNKFKYSDIKIDTGSKFTEISIDKIIRYLSNNETRKSFIHEFRHAYQDIVINMPQMIPVNPHKDLDFYYNQNNEFDAYTITALHSYLKDFTTYSQSEDGKHNRNLTIKNILNNLSNEEFYKHLDWRHKKSLKKRVFKYFYELGITKEK